MRGGDTLTDALSYALDRIGGPTPPVAVINASGLEDKSFVRQSNHSCNKSNSTLNGVFNTVLIRATRQTAETLGLVATAITHLDAKGSILIAQENAHGAEGLENQLLKVFPALETIIKYKCRIMVLALEDANLVELARWQAAAALQKVPTTGFWSAPGLFSWDRVDPASKMLLDHLPQKLEGMGADLGCGYGYLSVHLIKKSGVEGLYALDNDARAVEACRKNLEDMGAALPFQTLWRDATETQPDIPKLDWLVMNPPFHTQQHEDRELGQKFCISALKMLKSGGKLYLVANRHMPYEAVLEKVAKKVQLLAEVNGFKILTAEAP
ncbi:MAG: class I SAM-dependent methyltransferase [Proteobacteria bacterium]|nr:class I SAM-dependent methyltransferase [Pseudomonadota bacterium]